MLKDILFGIKTFNACAKLWRLKTIPSSTTHRLNVIAVRSVARRSTWMNPSATILSEWLTDLHREQTNWSSILLKIKTNIVCTCVRSSATLARSKKCYLIGHAENTCSKICYLISHAGTRGNIHIEKIVALSGRWVHVTTITSSTRLSMTIFPTIKRVQIYRWAVSKGLSCLAKFRLTNTAASLLCMCCSVYVSTWACSTATRMDEIWMQGEYP